MKLKNEADADFVAQFIRMVRGKAKVLNEEELENQWMIKMIDEAEKEGGEVPEEDIVKILKQNGAKI